jgi:cytochrome c-type biogenesis protein CcmH/NrfG
MDTQPGTTTSAAPVGLPAKQVYTFACIFLGIGLLVGYFLINGHAKPAVARMQPSPPPSATATAPGGMHPKLTLDQMKQMADLQASALIEKSKADPKNPALLLQIAGVYQANHQFKEAAQYFENALKFDPKNVPARTQLASCLYYSGDVDGALNQLTQALKYQPNDPNSLFNLGMIKYRGKNDQKGAIAAWQELLKAHPDLDRKAAVENMIVEAQNSLTEKK